jgi:hypothetical protein
MKQNVHTLNIMNALDNIFGTKPKDSVFLPSQPFAVKLNCKSGKVVSIDDEELGDKIEISVVKVASYFGTLGLTENEEWMNILFVPAPTCDILPQDTVCSTVIKKRSLSAFHGAVTKLCGNGVNPAKGIFGLSFKAHSGKQGLYYSVKFDWREREGDKEQKQLDRIATFMGGAPDLVDSRLATQLFLMDGLAGEEVAMLRASAQQAALAPAK